jgi:excisionase family DNA binding protein
LGTTARHVRRLVSERRIPHIKVGGLVRFDLDDIDRWLDNNQRGPVIDGQASGAKVAPLRSTSRRRSAKTEPRNVPPRQFRTDQQQ